MTVTAITSPVFVRETRWWNLALRDARVRIGGGLLLAMLLICVATLPWTTSEKSVLYYDHQDASVPEKPPRLSPLWMAMGTDRIGHSLLGRCLIGGTISLTIGVSAAAISVGLGVAIGLIAGFCGGWIDAVLMRTVDILFGLPYILLVILLKIALEDPLKKHIFHGSGPAANLVVLFLAIGLVSWLEMARVIRGQVLSLRSLPFVEAARAAGLGHWRIFTRHLLPNLVGPITVYATLTVPSAILQESFLSFLGVGVQPPLPTWGSLAADGLMPALNPIDSRWWLLVFPCTLLAVTLLSLNFLGDGLRDLFDPKREAAKL
ncbi:MAG TPA: ABC transporter permease [Tepidisphaeraceae bacterium]|nr:ABC transporter permease [Tepidisphaeraceae bacterium]